MVVGLFICLLDRTYPTARATIRSTRYGKMKSMLFFSISVTQMAKHAERIFCGRVYDGSTMSGLCGISTLAGNKSKCNNTWLDAISMTFRTISRLYESFDYRYRLFGGRYNARTSGLMAKMAFSHEGHCLPHQVARKESQSVHWSGLEFCLLCVSDILVGLRLMWFILCKIFNQISNDAFF